MSLSGSSSGELANTSNSASSEPAQQKETKDDDVPKTNSLFPTQKHDQLPPSIQLLLQQYILHGKFKNNNQQPLFSNPQNTTIQIRIPPRPEKKIEYKYEEEDEPEAIQLKIPHITRQRVSISPRFLSRPTTPNKFLQPKRVLTPDWESSRAATPTTPEPKHFEDDSDEEPETIIEWNKRDMLDHHKILEILENRIIYGFDDKIQHPAQSIDLIYKGFTVVMSEEEHQKTERYNQENEIHIVPRFWDPRPWDKPDDLLSVEQSDELENKMTLASLPHPTKLSQLKSSHSSKKGTIKRSQSVMIGSTPRRGRPRRIQTDSNSLLLPIGTFETDDETQFSEWEDFI